MEDSQEGASKLFPIIEDFTEDELNAYYAAKTIETQERITAKVNARAKASAKSEAEKEYSVTPKFKNVYLSRFCVFPRAICDHTSNELNANISLKQTPRAIDLSDYADSMVIYDKGDSNGLEKIGQMRTITDFVECLNLLTNIGKGIRALKNENLNHGDIKWENCVVIDGKLKMIDLRDLQQFDEMKDPTLFTDFSYFALTPLVIFFNECGNSDIITHSDHILDAFNKNDSTIKNYDKGVENARNKFDTLMKHIVNPRLPHQLPIIQKLMRQKTFFNDKGKFDIKYNSKDWVEIINNLKRSYSNKDSPQIKILHLFSFQTPIL